jgi:NAD(P)H-flavin reductase/ferredoxin
VRLTFHGRGYQLRAGESVLDGLARHGVGLPAACRAGVCHSCLLRAETGDPGPASRAGLKPALQASGYFLACRARPVTDLTAGPAGQDMITPATLAGTRRLAGDVLAVSLLPHQPVSFRAGQHVALHRHGGVSRPYSIASLPGEAGVTGLEFHVRVYPGGAMSGWLATAAPGADIGLGVPGGQCFYLPGQPDAPLLLAGTGTGIAPLAAIARDALAHSHRGPIVVLQGAACPERLYPALRAGGGGVAGPAIRWRNCVHSAGEDIAGAVRAEFMNLAEPAAARAYLCGGRGSVARMRRALFMAGMSLASIEADEFVPAAAS